MWSYNGLWYANVNNPNHRCHINVRNFHTIFTGLPKTLKNSKLLSTHMVVVFIFASPTRAPNYHHHSLHTAEEKKNCLSHLESPNTAYLPPTDGFTRLFHANKLYFLYAVKVRRHMPWSRVPLSWIPGMWFTLCQFHSRWHSLRITLKSTTLVCMRSSNEWTTKPWQRS